MIEQEGIMSKNIQIKGTKLKLCRNVCSVSLYKNGVFLLLLLMRFHCYGNLNSPVTYNGESENWPLLLCLCRYSDKHFTETFLESSSNQTYNFFPNL